MSSRRSTIESSRAHRRQRAFGRQLGQEMQSFTVQLHASTRRAWLVQFDNGAHVWIPKSQGDLFQDEPRSKCFHLFIPAWLAERNGLRSTGGLVTDRKNERVRSPDPVQGRRTLVNQQMDDTTVAR